jgi:hypothetical protein
MFLLTVLTVNFVDTYCNKLVIKFCQLLICMFVLLNDKLCESILSWMFVTFYEYVYCCYSKMLALVFGNDESHMMQKCLKVTACMHIKFLATISILEITCSFIHFVLCLCVGTHHFQPTMVERKNYSDMTPSDGHLWWKCFEHLIF